MIERYDPSAELQYVEPDYEPQYANELHGGAPESVVEYGEVEAFAAGLPSVDGPTEVEPGMAEVVGAGVMPKRRRSKAHWAAWLSAMVVMGVVLGGAIVAVMKFVNDPAEVTAQSLSKAQASASPTPFKPPTNQLGGINFEFTYPGEFDQVSRKTGDPLMLEQYMLGSKGNYRRSIAVEVRPLPSGGLSGDADYRVRQLHAADYKETTEKVSGEQIAVMTKQDKSEVTMFWPHADKLLTVAVTSSDPHDDVTAMLETVKMSVRWHK